MTVEEARRHLAKTVKLKRKLHRLFQLFLKISSINILQRPMIRRILNSYTAGVLDSMQESYSDLVDLIFEGLYKNNKINSVKKIAQASYYYKLLFDELMLFDYFKIDDLVVFDESIIHNSADFSDEEKVGIIFKNHKILKTSVIPVGVVHCYMDKLEYLERRKNRISEGRGISLDRTLKHKELEDLCYRSLKSAEEKIKVLKNYNIEILELNMEEPVSDNAKKAYYFINKLSTRL